MRPLFVLFLVLLMGTSCSSPDPAAPKAGSARDCSELEPENPYAPGSGHYAGFEWAERNDAGSCGGNSSSFIEGCEEYLRQSEAYESCVNKRE